MINDDRYGKFEVASELSQDIKAVMYSGPSFPSLSPQKREAMEEIANRISRIVNGNPQEDKPWEEIRNYVNLVLGN